MKDGVLLVNKPAGFTSFDVIAKLRGILKERKLGHGGTLDPNVTGVLPVFIKKATRAIDLAPTTNKKYTATFKLGIKTDTQDIWGEIIEEKTPERDIEKIREAVLSFKGNQKQLPPMYSAIKINGKRLYDLAREGIKVERKYRDITVYSITFEGRVSEDEYKFSLDCSKGSYVRTICNDIGEALGCGAVMTSLCRSYACGIELSECFTLEELQELKEKDELYKALIPLDKLIGEYPEITVTENQAKRFSNGGSLMRERVKGIKDNGIYRVYGQGKFLGLGELDDTDLKVKRVYNNV